eukprot:2930108-Pyramimonas_sp.AAC.1
MSGNSPLANSSVNGQPMSSTRAAAPRKGGSRNSRLQPSWASHLSRLWKREPTGWSQSWQLLGTEGSSAPTLSWHQ